MKLRPTPANIAVAASIGFIAVGASAAAAKAQFESANESESSLVGSIGRVQLEQLNQQAIAAQSNVVKATAAKDQAVASFAWPRARLKAFKQVGQR